MAEPLSDQQLIQLVQEKTPGELSADELDRLRLRLRESSELRDVLLEQLHLDTYLGAALGRFQVSVDEIVGASALRPTNRISKYWDWRLLLLIGLGLTSLLAMSLIPPRRETAQQPQLADLAAAPAPAGLSDPAPETKTETDAEPTPPPAVAATDAKSPPTDPVPSAPPVAAVIVPNTWRQEIEAEAFSRGQNVAIDNRNLGREIGVIYSDNRLAAFVEYDVEVPTADRYRLELRYASKESRPLALSINGQQVKREIAARATRDPRPPSQTWFMEGVFELQPGKNVIRLDSTPAVKQKKLGLFPAIDKLLLAAANSRDPSAPPLLESGPEPWDEVVKLDAPVRPLATATFDISRELGGMRQQDLLHWLEPVPGAPHRFAEALRNNVAVAVFEGLARLRAPWPEGVVLRLALFDHFGLKLHCWNGREGVTLQYYQQPRPGWAAYSTSRSEEQAQPSRLTLIGTDEGRYERNYFGPVEVRHQDGTLVLSRGDVRLLTVPLAEPPDEFFFEGKASFRGISMYRGEPLPAPPPNTRPYVLRSDQPALLAWKRNLPTGAKLTKLADGQVELEVEKSAQPATLAVPLEAPGLYEVIFAVENATPGTGVFLGNAEGRPLHQIGFFREQRTGATTFGSLRPGDLQMVSNFDPNHQPTPFAGPRQWLRLVLGHGSLKCWTSGDGIHWSRAFDPERQTRGEFSHVGIYALQGDGRRSITLQHLEVRELHALTGIVSDELREQALALPGNLEIEAWLQTVLENEPAGVDPNAWRQACALRTLGGGAWGALGRTLLSGILADVVSQSTLSAERRLQCLEEAALLADTWEQHEAVRFVQAYEQLGQILALEGTAHPAAFIMAALRSSPMWTPGPFPTQPEALIRKELLQLAYDEQWDQTWEFCRQMRYWNWSGHPDQNWPGGRDGVKRLVDWAEAGALRTLPERRGMESAVTAAPWRHPLIEELSKEGYNILAEFEAALSGEAYQDACQIVSGAGTAGALGLLPDAKDRRLMVSLPRAVALAMREHPTLQETMAETFGPVGKLRVRQAIVEADVPALQAATMQFTGTEAAAEAHAWLGDRALAGGSFPQAVGQYQQALRGILPPRRAEVAAKLRLAHAMLGQEFGEPVTQPVELGTTQIAAAEFEQLVDEMRRNRGRSTAGPQTAQTPTAEANLAPLPASYQVGRTLPFEGDVGHNAGNNIYPGVDAGGREYAGVIADGTLFLSNRFQIHAFDLAGGQKKWSQGLGGEQGDARSWPLRAMRPVIAGERIFMRRLTRHGPEIVCLETATGKLLWSRRPGDHVASDPLVVQEDLFVLSVTIPQAGILHVSLVALDPQTGETLAENMLLQLRDVWSRQVPCDAVAVNDKIVATIGGSVLSCDLFGQPRWLRRQTWLPPAQEPSFFTQHRNPPLVAGRRVYVTQPGVLTVDCLDLESGRLLWQQVVPDIRRVLGLIQNRLIVESNAGLQALDAETGAPQWYYPAETLLEAALCGGPGGILCAGREELKPNLRRPCLVWLNPETGSEIGRAPLGGFTDKNPLLGPFLAHGDRLWAGMSLNERDPRRQFIELVPAGPAAPGAAIDPFLIRWTNHVDPQFQLEVAETLPGWTALTQPPADHKAGLQPEQNGERDILLTRTSKERATVFARRVALRASGHPKLLVKAGVEPGHHWQLSIRVNNQTVLNKIVEPVTSNVWQELEVDLTAYAGQTVWLTVSQYPLAPAVGVAYWRRLDVVD